MQNTLFFGIDLSHPLGKADPNLKLEHVVSVLHQIFTMVKQICQWHVGCEKQIQHVNEKLKIKEELLEEAEKKQKEYEERQQVYIEKHSPQQQSTSAPSISFSASVPPPKRLQPPTIPATSFPTSLQQQPSFFVYRSSLSETEVQKVQEEEVSVLKATIDKLKAQSTEFNFSGVKLTVIMANTKTNFCLFKDEIDTRDKSPMQNVPSGTCVSEKIVSRRVPSFILVAQRALIGRPAVYHVLEGADAFPLDQIQYVTYCLCFSHGIIWISNKITWSTC